MKIVLFAKRHIWKLLIALAVIFATYSLLSPGLPPTHDGEYHVVRFYEFFQQLGGGVWYPRWAADLNFGYGVPLFTYVYPLPNFFAALLHLLGLSFINSFKWEMILATVTGAFGMYKWAKLFWGEKGAAVSAIVYTLAPYHFVDMYIRGSVGEVLALGLFPLFLWVYTAFSQQQKKSYAIASVVSLALIIFAHNILALMFVSFAVSYMALLILQNAHKRFLATTTVCILFGSLGLSAIFWLPALAQTHLTTGLQVYDIKSNFPDLFQLLFPSWGSGFFGTITGDEMSVQIGVVNLVTVAVALGGLSLKKATHKVTILYFLSVFFVLCCLMLSFTYPVWQVVPLLHYFQFPWRLLSLVILVCAFLAGAIFANRKTVWAILFIIFAILVVLPYNHAAYMMVRNDSYYISRSNFIDSTNSPGNVFNTIWQATPKARSSHLLSFDGTSSVKKLSPTDYTLTTNSNKSSMVTIALTYFPTWKVGIDGKAVATKPEHGYLSFVLPSGKHTVQISQTLTPIELTATIISVASALLVLGACFL